MSEAMVKGNSIEETIRKRYSCRSYRETSLAKDDRDNLAQFVSQNITGPFGSSARFTLFAAESSASSELKGLGTYGFIKNPAAFVAGVVKESEMNPEDFGYSMERIILHATDLGLGTCWLGGSFKRSSFAEKAGIGAGESVPAVASIGYIADKKTTTDQMLKVSAGSKKRKSADELFFDRKIKKLNIDFDKGYGKALEMVRLAPSASNRQPWRVVKEDGKNTFHFYLERSSVYSGIIKFMRYADLQKIDMGIAMCHFECSAIESGLRGMWVNESPGEIKTPAGWEYSITWEGK